MNSNNPINLSDVTYNKFNINLAISTSYNNGNEEVNLALRVIPSDSNNNTLDNNAIGLVRGYYSELDSAEQEFIDTIANAIQNLINNKGW